MHVVSQTSTEYSLLDQTSLRSDLKSDFCCCRRVVHTVCAHVPGTLHITHMYAAACGASLPQLYIRASISSDPVVLVLSSAS